MRPAALRKKVLVVDDEPVERILLCRLPGLGDHESIPAFSAAEGLETAVRERPDSIFPAVMFDHHDNLLMFPDLKLDATLKHIPVVLLSSMDKNTLYHLRALPGVCGSGFLPTPEGFPEADELLGLLKTLTPSGAPAPSAGP